MCLDDTVSYADLSLSPFFHFILGFMFPLKWNNLISDKALSPANENILLLLSSKKGKCFLYSCNTNLCEFIPERSYSISISINSSFPLTHLFHSHSCQPISSSTSTEWLSFKKKEKAEEHIHTCALGAYRSKPLTALGLWIGITLPLPLLFCQSSLQWAFVLFLSSPLAFSRPHLAVINLLLRPSIGLT